MAYCRPVGDAIGQLSHFEIRRESGRLTCNHLSELRPEYRKALMAQIEESDMRCDARLGAGAVVA